VTEENENNSLEKSSNKIPMKLDFGSPSSFDLSFLPEKKQQEIIAEYAKGQMDIQKKAQELHMDANILKKNLDDFTDTAKSATENESSVTISHTQTNSLGRTEVIIGNTEQAGKGKLSKSQTGEKDFTPYYIFGGILALVLIFALMRG